MSKFELQDYRTAAAEAILQSLNETLGSGSFRQKLTATLMRWVSLSSNKPTLADLTALVSQAHECGPHQAAPVCAAWWLMRISAKLFDDLEDGDITDDIPITTNLALGLSLLAEHILLASPHRERDSSRACSGFVRAYILACSGQHEDLTSHMGLSTIDPDTWLAIASRKSGAFFGWAAWAPAALAGVEPYQLDAYYEFGSRMGILLQIADDYSGVWFPETDSDLVRGTLSLAISYGLSVADEKQKAQLLALLAQAQNGCQDSELRARSILRDLGAQVFILAAAQSQYDAAATALDSISKQGINCNKLRDILNGVFPLLLEL